MQIEDELIEKKARTVMKLITDIKLVRNINDEAILFCDDLKIFMEMSGCLDFYREFIRKNIQPDNGSYLPVLEKIISLGFNINESGCFGQTLLHFFVWNLEAVKFLLEKGANVNARDIYGDTALKTLIDYFEEFVPKYDEKTDANVRSKYERDVKDIILLFADYDYDFSIVNDNRDSLIDALKERCDFTNPSFDEVEIVYLIIQKLSGSGKHFKLVCQIINNMDIVADFYQHKNLSFSNNLTASALEETNSIWEAMDFFNRLSSEESLTERLGLFVYILKNDSFPSHFKETDFEPIEALSMIAFPEKLLDMVKLLLKDFDINYRFRKGNLLHLMLELRCYDEAFWLIQENIDINAKNSAGSSVIELVLKEAFALHDQKRHLIQNFAMVLLNNEKLDCSVTTPLGNNLFQLVWNMTIRVSEYTDYRIIALLVSRMYKNPMDLLTDCFSDHPLFMQKIIKPNPKAPFIYETKALAKFKKKLANNGSRHATAMQLFVKNGMQLNQVFSSLSPDEQLTIIAYRFIGLVTNTYNWNEHSFVTEDFQSFSKEAYPLMQLYHVKAMLILDNFPIYEVLCKILHLQFKVNTKGVMGQTLLHSVVTLLDTKALQLLLESGADPNIEDCYEETPLFKLVHLLFKNPISDSFFDSVILLKKFNANFQTHNCNDESLLEVVLEAVAHTDGNIEKLLSFVALIAVQCMKNPIKLLDTYFFDEEERKHLYQQIYYYQEHFPDKDLTVKRNSEKDDDNLITKKPRLLNYPFFTSSINNRGRKTESTSEFIQTTRPSEMDF